MNTEVLRIENDSDAAPAIDRAGELLASGRLVAFPTETVYGLGANVTDPEALARLRRVKQRPGEKPFTVHVPSKENVDLYVPEISHLGRRLVQKAWPGPLTLLFHVNDPEQAPVIRDIGSERAAEIYFEHVVGIRCPGDPVATGILAKAGTPVVAASANPAGASSPTTADEVLEALNGQIDLLVDTGRTRYAKASTIVRLNGDGYQLVREGVLDERTLNRLSKTHILFVCTGNTCRSPMAEALCKSTLAEKIGCDVPNLERHGFVVRSAGVLATTGCRASQNAVQALSEKGVDLSTHTSQPVTVEMINQADYIYVMTEAHRESVTSLLPAKADRVQTLRSDGDVEDPMGSDEQAYLQCAERIGQAVRERLKELPI